MVRRPPTLLALCRIPARPTVQWQSGERWFLKSLRAAFEEDHDQCVEGTRQLLETGFHDPEGILFCARNLARVNDHDFALQLLDRTVDGGFYCSLPLVQDPWFDSVRADRGFLRILHRAEEKSREAAAAFKQAGGERLLGIVGPG